MHESWVLYSVLTYRTVKQPLKTRCWTVSSYSIPSISCLSPSTTFWFLSSWICLVCSWISFIKVDSYGMYSRWNCWVIEQRYVWLYKKLPKSAPTWLYYFFFHLFLLVGGWLLYNIVMVFAIHWHESAMDLHVFPIPITPPGCIILHSH